MAYQNEKCILIVGAGPVGLSLAIMLKQMDIPFRIVDKREELMVYSRAFVIHSRTLEIFKQMAVVESVKDSGRIFPLGVSIHQDSEISSKFQLPPAESSEPYTVGLIQSKTEEILRKRLEELDVKIEYGVGVKFLHMNGDDVEYVEVETANNETEKMFTSTVIGCDGAHSIVRKLSGISFFGESNPIRMTLIDADIESNLPKENMGSIFVGDSRTMLLIWINETKARIVIPNQETDDKFNLETSLELIDAITPKDIKITKIESFSNVDIRERQSEYHNKGNVFLCGDSAHTHYPAGGYGMNTGIQDAYNLAWKLGYIYNGIGNSSVLSQTYQTERSGVAETLLKETGSTAKFETSPVNWFNNFLITKLYPFAMSLDFYSQKASNSSSMLLTKYEQNPLVHDTIPGWFYDCRVHGVGLRLPPFKLSDLTSGDLSNTHSIITGKGCFEIFLYIPKVYLEATYSSDLETVMHSLENSQAVGQLKKLSKKDQQYYNIHTILSNGQKKDQCVSTTGNSRLFGSNSTHLDRENKVGDYFGLSSKKLGLIIVRPDTVVGFASSLAPDSLEESIDNYFNQFLRKWI